jgi:predicted O-linked N-acetylglucosamine transferase (SPINDLY family)
MGATFQAFGELDEAVRWYRQALQHKPDYPEAHFNLGVAHQLRGALPEAIAEFRATLDLRPAHATALVSLMHVSQLMCEWSGIEDLWIETKRRIQNEPSAVILPYTVITMPSSGEEQLLCARNWVANRLSRVQSLRAGLGFTFVPGPRDRLRIGYVSADYHQHATAYLLAELFELHDRERFEVIAYSIGRDDASPMRQRLVAGCDRFVDLQHHSFVAAAQQIHADGIDILVDLKGYTDGCRTEIFALWPAPIQVSYLGYPGTMGADFIDYLLTDRFVTPPEQQAVFSEELIELPDCYQVNDRKRPIAERTPTRAECGLPEEGVVFCCLNYAVKITPQMFGIWMRVLEAVPGSVLWLLESNRWVAENLRREAGARGVDPSRLVFAPPLPLAEHLARYRLADLFLDTYPVTAHTTASDALWVGLPVLTCAGETFVSRVAGSLLHAVGLADLVMDSLAAYEAKAIVLGRDAAERERLTGVLAANRETTPLFDTPRFTRHLEAAYHTMWERFSS